MVCPKCGNKLKCTDSKNDPTTHTTGRRYKCVLCIEKIYTIEKMSEKSIVNYLLSLHWQNGEREKI